MRNLLLCSLMIILWISGVRADDKTPTAPYKIFAGDVLDVNVQDHTDLSKSVAVLPDGTIAYPYIGEIAVSGLTLKELSAKMTAVLAKQIANPFVVITVQRMHEPIVNQVITIGAVKVPGKHVLKEGWRVLDLILDCGGLTVESGLVSASLVRGGIETIKLDIPKIMAIANLNVNILLKPDDVIMFTAADPANSEAQVLGEVNKPGYFPVTRDGAITAILNAAGGVTARASLSKAMLTHNGVTKPVDLHTLLTEGRTPEGIIVQPGDTLFIPQNKAIFSVYGAVQKPGSQIYPEDMPVTILAALSIAGGQSTEANLKTVSLVHPSRDGKPSVTTLNLEVMLKKGDLSRDIVIQPGDIVYVAPKSQRRPGEGLLEVLTFIPILNLLHIPL